MGLSTRVKRVVRRVIPWGKKQGGHANKQTEKEVFFAGNEASGFPKKYIWAFMAGQFSQDFRGNPKYLFVYINEYRKDIFAYWICDNEDTLDVVRKLGYRAYNIKSPNAQILMNQTGVLVTEQVKQDIPEALRSATYLNLWHGVGGFKSVERSIKSGDLLEQLSKKYIEKNSFYKESELYLATSPLIESIAMEQLGLSETQIVRGGYPRCQYTREYGSVRTFDHNILRGRGLSSNTRIVAYVPTYRSGEREIFAKAIEDFVKLEDICEKQDLLIIFKMHNFLENEIGFQAAKNKYENSRRFLFWDNSNDFYEIINQIDVCVFDYSSIFTDFVASGTKHFIRYIFDYDEYDADFPLGYEESTLGTICSSFEELLECLCKFDSVDLTDDINRVRALFWEYDDGNSFDHIIDTAIAYKKCKSSGKTLYSFDIFDTVFSRKVLDPVGVFYGVKEKMQWSELEFPISLIKNYPAVRSTAEQNVREYYHKTIKLRESENIEVSLREIIQRIASVYRLSSQQAELLYDWEIEQELANVIPLNEQIDLIKRLISRGEQVILISDMYLDKDVVQKMLCLADPILAELPLFLSSDYGVQKVSKRLFEEVYSSFEPYYDFDKWIHYGDNAKADISSPRKLNIKARKVEKPVFNSIQKSLTKEVGTYDAFLVAAMQARLCKEYTHSKDEFVISFISLCFVPYIDWAIRDAIERGYKTLYFISRDGHHLKRIADAIIAGRGLDIKTKLIYASRRTWRIPSFVDSVDPNFWEPYGNFNDIPSKAKLLGAMGLDERTFCEFFPYIDIDAINYSNNIELKEYVEIFKNSEDYNKYLLELARKERGLVSGYLIQEIDPKEKYAFVEYYGRGYTQDCFASLWRDAIKNEDEDIAFYYNRTVLPTVGHTIRYNFTTNNTKQFFIESVFANMPYKSIQRYITDDDGKIVPVFESIPFDKELYDSMNNLLPIIADHYASLDLNNPEDTDRMLNEFMFNFYRDNIGDPEFASQIGPLVDSVALYGQKREYAPPLTEDILEKLSNKEVGRGSMRITTQMEMSLARTDDELRRKYYDLYQILPEDKENIGGRLLRPKEIEKNKKYKKKYNDLLNAGERFKEKYNLACSEKVVINNKIVFITPGKIQELSSLGAVYYHIREREDLRVINIAYNDFEGADIDYLASELSDARIIFSIRPTDVLCRTTIRRETDLVLLAEKAVPVRNQCLQFNAFERWCERYNRLAGTNDFGILELPSKKQERIFRDFYTNRWSTRTDLSGCCITDFYFSTQFESNAKNKIYKHFPEAKGKKIILYMPSVQKRRGSKNWLELLDLHTLQGLLGEEYVVAVNFSSDPLNTKEVYNVINIDGFSKEIRKNITIRELMVAADIIVGDYREAFFEAPLLNKPTFSVAYNIESVMKKRDYSYRAKELDDMIFCPVVATAEELVERINDIDNYDYTPLKEFRDTFLDQCNGTSVENVVTYINERCDIK